jgi:hypothetical protein
MKYKCIAMIVGRVMDKDSFWDLDRSTIVSGCSRCDVMLAIDVLQLQPVLHNNPFRPVVMFCCPDCKQYADQIRGAEDSGLRDGDEFPFPEIEFHLGGKPPV